MGVPADQKNFCDPQNAPMEMAESGSTMETCANPACDQPGTNKCSACKTTCYCGPICQTADWAHHKEECPGHLRKVGMANLEKAKGFLRANNWPQVLRYSDLAAIKLKQLKDCPLEDLSKVLNHKFNALNMMDRNREALECAKEWYCLWLTKHTHPPAIHAGTENSSTLYYVHALLGCKKKYLAKATFALAQSGGISAEEKQASGVEAIALARRALEIHTQLHGAESHEVAEDMSSLALVLDYFNDVDDDEVPLLYERAKAIFARVFGSLSPNVAAAEKNLGVSYGERATRAHGADDLDSCVVNLELALTHHREAARIYRAVNRVDAADSAIRDAVVIENNVRHVRNIRAAATALCRS